MDRRRDRGPDLSIRPRLAHGDQVRLLRSERDHALEAARHLAELAAAMRVTESLPYGTRLRRITSGISSVSSAGTPTGELSPKAYNTYDDLKAAQRELRRWMEQKRGSPRHAPDMAASPDAEASLHEALAHATKLTDQLATIGQRRSGSHGSSVRGPSPTRISFAGIASSRADDDDEVIETAKARAKLTMEEDSVLRRLEKARSAAKLFQDQLRSYATMHRSGKRSHSVDARTASRAGRSLRSDGGLRDDPGGDSSNSDSEAVGRGYYRAPAKHGVDDSVLKSEMARAHRDAAELLASLSAASKGMRDRNAPSRAVDPVDAGVGIRSQVREDMARAGRASAKLEVEMARAKDQLADLLTRLQEGNGRGRRDSDSANEDGTAGNSPKPVGRSQQQVAFERSRVEKLQRLLSEIGKPSPSQWGSQREDEGHDTDSDVFPSGAANLLGSIRKRLDLDAASPPSSPLDQSLKARKARFGSGLSRSRSRSPEPEALKAATPQESRSNSRLSMRDSFSGRLVSSTSTGGAGIEEEDQDEQVDDEPRGRTMHPMQSESLPTLLADDASSVGDKDDLDDVPPMAVVAVESDDSDSEADGHLPHAADGSVVSGRESPSARSGALSSAAYGVLSPAGSARYGGFSRPRSPAPAFGAGDALASPARSDGSLRDRYVAGDFLPSVGSPVRAGSPGPGVGAGVFSGGSRAGSSPSSQIGSPALHAASPPSPAGARAGSPVIFVTSPRDTSDQSAFIRAQSPEDLPPRPMTPTPGRDYEDDNHDVGSGFMSAKALDEAVAAHMLSDAEMASAGHGFGGDDAGEAAAFTAYSPPHSHSGAHGSGVDGDAIALPPGDAAGGVPRVHVPTLSWLAASENMLEDLTDMSGGMEYVPEDHDLTDETDLDGFENVQDDGTVIGRLATEADGADRVADQEMASAQGGRETRSPLGVLDPSERFVFSSSPAPSTLDPSERFVFASSPQPATAAVPAYTDADDRRVPSLMMPTLSTHQADRMHAWADEDADGAAAVSPRREMDGDGIAASVVIEGNAGAAGGRVPASPVPVRRRTSSGSLTTSPLITSNTSSPSRLRKRFSFMIDEATPSGLGLGPTRVVPDGDEDDEPCGPCCTRWRARAAALTAQLRAQEIQQAGLKVKVSQSEDTVEVLRCELSRSTEILKHAAARLKALPGRSQSRLRSSSKCATSGVSCADVTAALKSSHGRCGCPGHKCHSKSPTPTNSRPESALSHHRDHTHGISRSPSPSDLAVIPDPALRDQVLEAQLTTQTVRHQLMESATATTVPVRRSQSVGRRLSNGRAEDSGSPNRAPSPALMRASAELSEDPQRSPARRPTELRWRI